ncbi:MAG: hemolysin family protein [Anaerolineae bacterium]
MDDGHLPSLLTIGLLIVLHAGVQFAYAALTNSRLTALNERAEAGDIAAKHTLILVENLFQLRVMSELLITALRLTLAAVAIVGIAQPLIDNANGGLFSNAAAVYLLVLLPVGLLDYVFGDLITATFGRAAADAAAPYITPVVRLLLFLLKPVVVLMVALEGLAARMSGGENLTKAVTEEEILSLVDVGQRGGTIESDEKDMIYSVLQFNEIAVREIMIPRPDITAIEISEPLTEALKTIVETGHSRVPVYEDEIDNIQGVLFAKDLLTLVQRGELDRASLRQIIRKVHFVPESKRADNLFKEMQVGNIHIAIVVDEYGSTAGLVTIEDLLEEIVGDIRDEYDQNEESEFTALTVDTFLVDGAMQLTDLNDRLNVELSTEDSDTLGGYIYSRLGQIPQVGQTLEAETLIMRIDKVENRRIRKVHITRAAPPAEPETKPDETAEHSRARGEIGGAPDRPAQAMLRQDF